MKSFEAYDLWPADKASCNLFTTRHGIEYFIGVSDYSNSFGLPSANFKNPMMYFALEQIDKRVLAPFDPRIRATVVCFIYNYLIEHPDDVIFYVCSAQGGKENHRRNTFNRWFNTAKEHRDLVQKKVQLIEDQEIHFLYRKDQSTVARLLDEIDIYSALPGHLVKS